MFPVLMVSMFGCFNGLQALFGIKSSNVLCTLCIIHREGLSLGSRHLSPALNQVLKCVVNVVNLIKKPI